MYKYFSILQDVYALKIKEVCLYGKLALNR